MLTMCSIAGIIDLSKENRISISHVEKMLESMIHRGPEDQGIVLHKKDKMIPISTHTTDSIKMNNLSHKKSNIPNEIIYMKKKEFCTPDKQWFENELDSTGNSLLNNFFSRNLFNNSNLNKHKTLFIITKI